MTDHQHHHVYISMTSWDYQDKYLVLLFQEVKQVLHGQMQLPHSILQEKANLKSTTKVYRQRTTSEF
jgi:hypothetical protein